jgi:hypothetical protein
MSIRAFNPSIWLIIEMATQHYTHIFLTEFIRNMIHTESQFMMLRNEALTEALTEDQYAAPNFMKCVQFNGYGTDTRSHRHLII